MTRLMMRLVMQRFHYRWGNPCTANNYTLQDCSYCVYLERFCSYQFYFI